MTDGSYTLAVTAAGFRDKTMEISVPGGAAAGTIVLSADPAHLRQLYEQYKGLEQGGYTAESWQALQDALAEAKAVLDQGAEASDESILAACGNLIQAANGLRTISVNKDTLRILFNAYNAQTNTGYTDKSWNALQNALNEAARILSDPGAVQQAVDDAVDALQRAYDGLVPGSESTAADKSALRSLYEACAAIRNTGYTDGSWNALQTALARAEAVLNDSDASQTEVDAAYASLRSAHEGLTASPVIIPPAAPAAPGKPSDTKPAEETPPSGEVEAPVVSVPGTTQETTINPDGSITITITDTSNHTVAVITENTDGTVTVIVAISPEAAAKQPVRLPVPEMAEGAQLTVTLPEDAGKTVILIPTASSDTSLVAIVDGKVVRDSMNGRDGLRLTLTGDAQIRIVDNSKSVQDVAAGSWYYSAVRFVSSHELFQGTASGQFSPQAAMDRGMLVTVLWRLAGEPDAGSGSVFSDIAPDAWYSDAVAWASSEGIVNGISQSLFKPADHVTREQVAAFLYRFAQWKGITSGQGSGSLQDFRDGSQVSSWARDAMAWAVACGIISGKDAATLDPQGQATRAEVAAMLERFMSL